MDIKILSFGETISDVFADKSFLSANCYFEWLNLKSIPLNKMSKNIFDFKSIENLRNTFSDCFHLQDSLLLVSDEEPKKFLETPSHMYVSLINLPMWNEKLIKDSSTYVAARNEIKNLINNIIDKKTARLYSAFEYCDYVLLCDASKVTLSEYLRLINKIRLLTIQCKKSTIKAVHNIITIYGYSENETENNFDSTERLCLTVGMSFKESNDVENFKNVLKDAELIDNIVSLSQVFGQYDYIICWNNLSNQLFNKILDTINKNKNIFLNYRIYIGSPEEKLKLPFIPTDKDKLKEFEISELVNLSSHDFEFLKKPPFSNHLYYAINDINYSLKLLLNKGLAQYYVLSFYESFNSFVSYLKKLSQGYYEEAKTQEELENNKMISEKVFDMFRTYFGVLNALNECTTHSRKQFLQIAPCQMMYFDAPPKLIAFYTAIINRIVRALNFDIKDKYTFLITPDFKNDIFVDSLTEDKTLGEEHNLLIIHMSEESMYNIVQSLKIVVHEIFHHIGQKKALRHQRSKMYLKCCLADILANCLPVSSTSKMDDCERYKFFVDFIDELYSRIFTDKDNFFSFDKWFKDSNIDYEIDEVFYYSDYLIKTFIEYLNHCFSYRIPMIDMISEILNYLCAKGHNIYGLEFWETDNMSIEDQGISREFMLKNLSFEIQSLLSKWIIQNNNEDAYAIVQYVFRESFADARMLMLISDENNYINVYKDILGNPISHEDIIREAVIIKFFAQSSSEKEVVKQYEEALTINNKIEDKMKDLFYLYLRNETFNYLALIEEPKAPRYINTKTRINEIMDALNNNNIDDIIDKMDEEIFNYRKLLIEKDDI